MQRKDQHSLSNSYRLQPAEWRQQPSLSSSSNLRLISFSSCGRGPPPRVQPHGWCGRCLDQCCFSGIGTAAGVRFSPRFALKPHRQDKLNTRLLRSPFEIRLEQIAQPANGQECAKHIRTHHYKYFSSIKPHALGMCEPSTSCLLHPSFTSRIIFSAGKLGRAQDQDRT